MTKTLLKIHSWLGLAFGIIILTTCFTGALLELLLHSDAAGTIVFKLHRWLMDVPIARGESSAGKLIVGVSTMALVVLVITGMMLWAVQAKANLAASLKLRFNRGLLSMMRSLHVAGGIYVSLPVLIMAITGLTWSFGWWRDVVYSLFGNLEASEIRHLIFGLHSGTFGGLATQILWGLAALMAATLPVTGYWLWLRKRKNKSKNQSHA